MIRNKFILTAVIFAATVFFSCSSSEDKLFKAIKNGDIETVKEMIGSKDVHVLTVNKNGLTPLEVARLNNQKEIAAYIYEEVRKLLDRETNSLLSGKFQERFRKLKSVSRERKKYYGLYSESAEKLIQSISEDARLKDEIINQHEQYFQAHTKLVRELVNSKVDLIEDIMREFVKKDYAASVESKDIRQIVNLNITENLEQTPMSSP
jgi:hypothetical protein